MSSASKACCSSTGLNRAQSTSVCMYQRCRLLANIFRKLSHPHVSTLPATPPTVLPGHIIFAISKLNHGKKMVSVRLETEQFQKCRCYAYTIHQAVLWTCLRLLGTNTTSTTVVTLVAALQIPSKSENTKTTKECDLCFMSLSLYGCNALSPASTIIHLFHWSKHTRTQYAS